MYQISEQRLRYTFLWIVYTHTDTHTLPINLLLEIINNYNINYFKNIILPFLFLLISMLNVNPAKKLIVQRKTNQFPYLVALPEQNRRLSDWI